MALLGPERRRPTVFYSSSFSVWRGLGGAGDVLYLVAGERRLGGAVEILPLVAGRVGPQLSR